MTTILKRLACTLGWALSSAAMAQSSVSSGINTTDIFSATLQAAPSCLRYTVTGACGWLHCSIGCSFKITPRIQHFTPDLTVSTWHDAALHPWRDYGRRIAGQLNGAGTRLIGMATGNLEGKADSAGTRSPFRGPEGPQRAGRNLLYRGADAIGNPVNLMSWFLTGSGASSESASIPVPTSAELMSFFSTAGSQLSQQWAAVPQSAMSQTARGEAQQFMGLLGQTGTLTSTYTGFADTLKGANGLMNLAGSTSASPNNHQQPVVGTGQGQEWFCAPGAMPFALLFHSELDAWFWRGLIPLELMFPAPWIPGMREVGAGLQQTWGSVWPRQGALFQQHPVKGSAVLAQRVGDIVSEHAQPHIYTALDLKPAGYHWFGFQGIREADDAQTRWQRVYPAAQKTCRSFGYNDSIALTGFGDFHNTPAQGFIWNAWRRQECCKAPAGYVYVGSVAR